MSKEETLKKLQELQLKYLGEVDMNVRYEIETRKDQRCTMEVKKKRPPRERKVDAEKGYILNCVKGLVEEIGGIDTSVKTETELSFIYNGNKYTLKLTKHRPPKEV